MVYYIEFPIRIRSLPDEIHGFPWEMSGQNRVDPIVYVGEFRQARSSMHVTDTGGGTTYSPQGGHHRGIGRAI